MELFDSEDDYSSEEYNEFIKLLAFNSEDMADLKGGIPVPTAALAVPTAALAVPAVPPLLADWRPAGVRSFVRAPSTPLLVEPASVKRKRAVKMDAAENMRKRGAACIGKRVTQRDVMEGEVDADVLFSSAAKMYKGLQKANKELVDELQELKGNLNLLGQDLARERALSKEMYNELALYKLRGEPPALVDLC